MSHNKEIEEAVEDLEDDFFPPMVGSELPNNVPPRLADLIAQAEQRGASKLAEELLGSAEMRLKNYPHQDATQDREIKSHNKSISAIIVLAEAIEIGRISGLVEEVSTILYGEHGDELLID